MSFDPNSLNLTALVLEKITALGDDAAEEYFGVSHGTIVAWRTRKTPPNLAAAQKCWDDSVLAQTPAIWGSEGKSPIALLMPMYETVEPLALVTIYRAAKFYGPEKITLIPKIRTLITEARNDLAHKFMASSSEWAIMIDSDMIIPCGNGAMLRSQGCNLPEPKASRNAFERLMSHPPEYKIVGALYKDRRQGTRAQCELAFRSAQENERLIGVFDGKGNYDGLEETGWLGFGLIKIHRSVFQSMRDAAQPGGSMEDIAPPKGRDTEPYGFFRTTAAQRGEDVVFCRRAQSLGIKTYVDTGLPCGHVGRIIR